MYLKKKVLFICTRNSCRSQIAHGLLNQLGSQYFEVFSAGLHPSQVHPISIKVITLLHKNIAKDINMIDCLTAFDIENKFVIGYGLDYNNLFRNLKDIYIDNE